jgi:hypothetical protein
MELQNTDKVLLTAVAKDAQGNVTVATLAFTSSDDTIVSLVDNGDGTAEAFSGLEGTATITATATDPDGKTVDGTLDITVVAVVVPPPPTETVEVTAGTPEPK